MTRIIKVSLIQAACALSFLAACSNPGGAPSQQSDSELVAQSNAKWSSTSIPVCWVNMTGSEQTAVELRDLTVSEYAKGGLCLTGWKQCSKCTPCPAIHIEVSNAYANYGYEGWSYVGPKSICSPSQETIWLDPRWAKASIVHEVGHAVGFLHEHERADNNNECKDNTQQLQQSDGSLIFLTSYDEKSAMSYCGQDTLTSTDIAGIRKFYGTSGTASCGENSSGSTDNGQTNEQTDGNETEDCVDDSELYDNWTKVDDM